MNLFRSRKFTALSLLAGSTVGLIPVSGLAQTTEKKDEEVKMEKFVVTGSLIPFAADAPAIPITTVDVKDIERSGSTSSVLEVLRKSVPQFTGNGNIGSTNANIASGSTNGGSQLSLYNAQTLVLINGRRAAYAPVGASGGFVFVDVNLIPVSAIEKIDVLTDGASAIYGSDAVSGVVNIILKTDYEGAEVGGRYGVSDNKGNWEERQAHVVVGAVSGKTSITASAEWYKSDPLFQYERPFSAVAYGTATFAGSVNVGSSYYYLKPGTNAPSGALSLTPTEAVAAGIYTGPNSLNTQITYFNLANYVTLLQSNQRQSATVAFNHKVNENLTFFGDMLYANTKTQSQLNAQPFAASITAADANSPFSSTVTVRNRFTDYPRIYKNDTTSIRGVAGVKGSFGDGWYYETAANQNIVKQDYENNNLIDTAARIAAVANGTINIFARTQAAGAIQASGMLGTALATFESKLTSYDAKIGGKVFELPAGTVQIAIGAEHRIESFDADADRNSQTDTFGWDSGTTVDPFFSRRDIDSIYGEVKLPLLAKVPGAHLLELSVAGRVEKYSDTDDPTVPKYTVRWQPFNDEFALRGTYGESFGAPTLFQLFGPGGVGFTSSLNLSRYGGGDPIQGQANSRSGANPSLLPSESRNFTVGAVYSPKAVRGLELSVDYFNIDQRDLISTIGSETILQSVELLGADSPYAKYVKIGSFTGTSITTRGQIGNAAIDNVYVSDQLTNIAGQELSGYNLRIKYTKTFDTVGRFDFLTNALIWEKYEVQTLPTVEAFDTIGYASNTNGTVPEYEFYSGVDWSRGNWGASIGLRYWPKVEDLNAYAEDGWTEDERSVEKTSQIDVSASYVFGSKFAYVSGLKLRVGVNNVFNELPPLSPATFTESNADIATYNPIGRLFFVEAGLKF